MLRLFKHVGFCSIFYKNVLKTKKSNWEVENFPKYMRCMQKKLYLCTVICAASRSRANTDVVHFSDRTRHKRIDMRPKSFP